MGTRCATCGANNVPDAQYCGQCGRQLSGFAVDPRIGQVVAARYQVLRSLDEGGMSHVYVADQRLGRGSRDVALKILKVDLARDAGIGERFAREVELLGQLQHPNTVRIFDYGELEDGLPYMVMELVAGQPLSEVIGNEAPLAPNRVEQIAIQIASALGEAHQHGIIHRDLKPHNVMLGEAGPQKDFVKVLDFGIARRVQGHELKRDITMKGTILGTPPYMAPEQFEGGTIDQRTDIYALGVMLYELYTGELPFMAASPMAWATQHLTAQPKPFEETASGAAIPEHSRRAVMRALSKPPGDRPQSMIELLKELTGRAEDDSKLIITPSGRVAVGSSSPPPMGSPAEIAVPTERASRAVPIVIFGLIALLSLSIVTIGLLWWTEREDEAHSVAPPETSLGSDPDAGPSTEMDAAPPRYGFTSVHHVSHASDAQNALGLADGRAAELIIRGILTLEIARETAFSGDGSPEPDLFIIALEGSGPFRIDVSEDHHRYDTVVSRSTDSAAVDLDASAAGRLHYVRIRAASAAPVLIDAVEVVRTIDQPGWSPH